MNSEGRAARGEKLARRPVVNSIWEFPFDTLDEIEAVVSPQRTDSHVAVICAVKGIPILRAATEPVPQVAAKADPIRLPIQLGVLDENDIERSSQWPQVSQYFVRWEHLLYTQLGTKSLATALERTGVLAQKLARAAGTRPIVLRLPDVRSDDPLAPLFELKREPNPALGNHGTRYWRNASESHLRMLRATLNGLPSNVLIAAPFVSSPQELVELQEKLQLELLVPFVETPSFLFDAPAYGNLPIISVGLKDLSALMWGVDREGSAESVRRDNYEHEISLQAIAPMVRHLIELGVSVSIPCPPTHVDTFSRLLGTQRWTPSIPFGNLYVRNNQWA